MENLYSKLPFRGHEIYIGYGYLNTIPSDMVTLMERNPTVCIISDATVAQIYGLGLKTVFQELEVPCTMMIIESTNNAANCAKQEIDQIFGDTFIVSLGGSFINRFAETLAENCKNCVGFSKVVTTLWECVDLSIEHIEVDDVEGKNLQPKRVYIDLEMLQTLPRRHIMNGMSEIIKVAAVHSNGWRKWAEQIVEDDVSWLGQDDNLLDFIETNASQLLAIQRDVIVEVVVRTIEMKTKIVNQAVDKKNPVLLRILKLGHSIGDSIEALTTPKLLRGECIGIGMVKEAVICGEKICSSATAGRLIRCLKRFELPTRIPPHLNTYDILANMKTFPKNSSVESIELVLEKQIAMVPGMKASGTIRIPGSKSISNRVLLLAAMGNGTCHISGLLHSDDTHVMVSGLERIGAKFRWIDNDTVLVVQGTGGKLQMTDPDQVISVNHSGITARFLTSLLTLVKGLEDKPIILTGSSRLKERPIRPLVDALRTKGCKIEYLQKDGCLPLAIYYTGLEGSVLKMSGKISSTFVSSILLSAPYASSPMILELAEENPTSLPYILMTTQLMAKFNVQVKQQGNNRFTIPCGPYENPSHIEIEADASSATYCLALAAVTRGTVCIRGLGQHSLQGDAKFYSLLQSMGCNASQFDDYTTVSGPSNGVLKSVNVNMGSMTDAFMTAVVLGSVAQGTTRITGIANQRVKESNRIEVMVTELRKIGISCGELDDGIWVEGIGHWNLEERQRKLKKAFISCHNDHRIAMSFAVLGCVLDQIIITDKDCTEKTYPEFWDDCRDKLGLVMRPIFESHVEETHQVAIVEDPPPCIFVIGMRASGKSMLGLKVAQACKLKFIDMDIMLEQQFQEPVSSFVTKYGWEKFRYFEGELLKDLMKNATSETIVCCGGGVIETEFSRMLLKIYPHVIYIKRDLNSIISNLNQETKRRRASLHESIEETYVRRLPWYEECSKLHFVINSNNNDVDEIHNNFVNYLSRVIPNISLPDC